MLDVRRKFETEHEINFIDEVLLAEDQDIYFYIDLNHNANIMTSTMHYIYAKISSGVLRMATLEEMLTKINQKSESCEVVGHEVYVKKLKQQILAMGTIIEVSIPLMLKRTPKWLKIRMRYLATKNMYVGRIKTNDEEHQEKLYVTSYKDSMTGLFNRNTLIIHLESFSREHGIYGVMIDIDHFKMVNDTYGHEKGDQVLKQFGKLLLSLADADAIFYRLAGDEFFIQIKSESDEIVISYLHRIQEGLRKIKVNGNPITVSMGVAKYEKCYYTQNKDILRFTDLAMYIAKSKGRNTYHILSMQELEKLKR